MTQSQKIRSIVVFIFVGFLFSIIYHLYIGFYLHKTYPYNTFLFRPEDRFGDFLDIFNAGKNPYNEIKASRGMFPFFMLISYVMYIVSHKTILLVSYTILFLSGLISIILNFIKQENPLLRLSTVLVLIFCTYPVLFSLDRMNIENGVFLLIFISIILLVNQKYILSSIAMGVAIAIKPYSIFFLPIFLIEGQIIPILVAGGVACFLSIGALLILPHQGLSEVNTLLANLTLYNEYYVIRNEGLYFGTSIFGALKVLEYSIGGVFGWFMTSDQVLMFNRSLLRPYFLITNIAFFAIIVILLFYKTHLWKKASILTACLALLPYVGTAYRLLYFFIPAMLFVTENERDKKDKFYAAIFSLIMIPTGYVYFTFKVIFLANPGETNDSVFFQPLIIIILLVSLLVDILRSRELNEPFVSMLKRFKLFLLPAK